MPLVNRIPHSCALALAIVCATLGICQPSARAGSKGPTVPPRFAVTDLGPLPRIADDVSIAVNESGQVAGWTPAGPYSVASTCWGTTGAARSDTPTGYLNGITVAINDRGETAGWVTTSENPVDSLATVRGVVYTSGTPRGLGTLGGRDSRVFGIGRDGETVGMSDLAARKRHGFFEDSRGMIDLGTLPAGSFSCAYAIDGKGNIVGVSDTGAGVRHAVLWAKGTVRDLGVFPNGNSSCALAINSRDDIAGYGTTGVEIHAFLLKAGKLIDLGDLGEDPSMARGVNNRDDVVGKCSISQVVSHAFFWRDGKMYDLNDLIPKTLKLTLWSGDSINDAGQIACEAVNRAGELHAVRLDPESDATGGRR